jgi:hypothetical protein
MWRSDPSHQPPAAVITARRPGTPAVPNDAVQKLQCSQDFNLLPDNLLSSEFFRMLCCQIDDGDL